MKEGYVMIICKENHHHDYVEKLNDDFNNFKHFEKMGRKFWVTH